MSIEFRVVLARTGREFRARAAEPILAAADRSAVWLPAGCRNGSCGACEATLVAGRLVPEGDDAVEVPGVGHPVRLCRARAGSDLVIDIAELPARPPEPASLLPARVVSLREGTCGRRLDVRLPAAARSRVALALGVRVSIRAPRGFEAALVVEEVGPDRIVTLRPEISPGGGLVDGAVPLPKAGDVLQIEVLREDIARSDRAGPSGRTMLA